MARIKASRANGLATRLTERVVGESGCFARRPGLYRPVKKPVTLRLDVDLVEWFKSRTPDGGYQTEINRVPRRYVAGAGR